MTGQASGTRQLLMELDVGVGGTHTEEVWFVIPEKTTGWFEVTNNSVGVLCKAVESRRSKQIITA